MNERMVMIIGGLLFAAGNALAGSVGGSRVVWFNLAAEPDAVNERITSFLESGRDVCWTSDSLVFMRNKPKGITRALVERAIIHRVAAAIKELNIQLKRPYDEAYKGFDGIIVYDDVSKPRMSSLTTGRSKIRRDMIGSLDEKKEELENSLCEVFPPIVRLP